MAIFNYKLVYSDGYFNFSMVYTKVFESSGCVKKEGNALVIKCSRTHYFESGEYSSCRQCKKQAPFCTVYWNCLLDMHHYIILQHSINDLVICCPAVN
mmetsp:Transcript_23814/g.41052  ORF Transcript_23814/g.41052 Transcript_23814/m.41052 type:complete len:98 (+) Transcript_23814:2-295(+)